MPLPNTLLNNLRSVLKPSHLLTDPADCWAYGYDNSRRHSLPDAVVFPENHAEVVQVVTACHAARVPLVARGRGTGTPGGAVPIRQGIVLSFERMCAIHSIDVANRVMVVEPGVTNQAVQSAAAAHGFFWPPDPTSSAFCSVGGNLAYNSAGPRAVKYGTPRENTLGLRAVTGDGRSLRTGVYTTKGVVGYDLTRLLIGSEGTLAIITEATLKLTPLPEAKQSLCAIYRSVAAAAAAVSAMMRQPVTPCALEFIDENALKLLREHAALPIPVEAAALLMIEVDGLASAMPAAVAAIETAAHHPDLLSLHTATTAAETQQLWQARKSLSPILRHLAPNKINEDVVVPVAALPALIDGLKALAIKHDILIVNFGHAGNGNIHVNLLLDAQDPSEANRAKLCLNEIFALVLQLKGTLSGEHGIGYDKRDYVALELEPAAIAIMRSIKNVFDPHGILNPEKIFVD